MFAMILRTHWLWTRALVAGLALIAFLMPAAAFRISQVGRSLSGSIGLMEGLNVLGPMLAFLALFGPFILAVYPWTLDAETKHVYPLSLPITWPRYVGMRYLAGALTLLLPALGLYLGGRFAVSMVDLPPLLRAYPGALALRFLLAALIAYSASFALQYLAGKRATVVALLLVVGVTGFFLLLGLLGAGAAADTIGAWLFEWPGPFGVFSQSWVLIDV